MNRTHFFSPTEEERQKARRWDEWIERRPTFLPQPTTIEDRAKAWDDLWQPEVEYRF